MSDQSSSPSQQSGQSLEDILAELEKKFSAPLESELEQPPKAATGHANFNRVDKKRLLAGLTLMFVITGSVAGFYLAQTEQELRNQAKETEIIEQPASPAETTYQKTIESSLEIIDSTGQKTNTFGANKNIVVTFSDEQVKSVILTFVGPTNQSITLNSKPFSIDYASLNLAAGTYSIEAVGYTQPNGMGLPVTPLQVSFEVSAQ